MTRSNSLHGAAAALALLLAADPLWAQYVPRSKYDRYFPVTTNPQVNALRHRARWYDESSMPRAYQIWDGGLVGVHSAWYNVSANRKEPFGNPNREFPWKGTAGMDGVSPKDGSSLRFVVMGGPVRWWRQRLRHDTHPRGTYRWAFAPGTVFGEVLLVHHGQKKYPFELRLRTKTARGWVVDVYRPPLDKKGLDRFRYTKKNKHPKRVINRRGVEYLLPKMSRFESLVALSLPFESVLLDNHGFTTRHRGGVVPVGYRSGFLPVDSRSCMACHDGAGKHASDFEPFLRTRRDWYGRVRGSDGIFSWHPFRPSSISRNGSSVRPVLRGNLNLKKKR